MGNYKLVPVEITDEMAAASGCEGCFGKSVHDQAQDMWTAMLAVAPAVHGELVTYAVFASNGNIRIWCADPVQAETLRQQYGESLQPIYAAPHPAEQQSTPDVAQLVEALEDIAGTHHHSASAGEYFAKVAREALAALAKARGES